MKKKLLVALCALCALSGCTPSSSSSATGGNSADTATSSEPGKEYYTGDAADTLEVKFLYAKEYELPPFMEGATEGQMYGYFNSEHQSAVVLFFEEINTTGESECFPQTTRVISTTPSVNGPETESVYDLTSDTLTWSYYEALDGFTDADFIMEYGSNMRYMLYRVDKEWETLDITVTNDEGTVLYEGQITKDDIKDSDYVYTGETYRSSYVYEAGAEPDSLQMCHFDDTDGKISITETRFVSQITDGDEVITPSSPNNEFLEIFFDVSISETDMRDIMDMEPETLSLYADGQYTAFVPVTNGVDGYPTPTTLYGKTIDFVDGDKACIVFEVPKDSNTFKLVRRYDSDEYNRLIIKR